MPSTNRPNADKNHRGSVKAASRWITPLLLVTAVLAAITIPATEVAAQSSPVNGSPPRKGGSGSHNGCPSPNAMLPCACVDKQKGLDISCEKTTTPVVNLTLRQLRNLGPPGPTVLYLKLRHLVDVSTLPDRLFDGLDLRHLTLVYSNVSEASEHAFAGLDRRLETLDLSQNRLRRIPSAALRSLRDLIYLNLNNNNISFIQAGALDGLDNLLRLSLYGNAIAKLDDSALLGASRSLTRINFGRNRLTAVPVHALDKMVSLEGLELQENLIERVSKEHFRGLERLDYLSLASNQLTLLEAYTFAHLVALNSLDLDGNRISVVDKDTFAGVENKLEWLKLGENRLNTFPSNALKKLIKLKQLDLHGNNLLSIPEDAFEDFGRQLKVFDANNNSISNIPANAFFNLHLLQWLHLNENKLKKIPQDTFEPVFDTLAILDVHNNPLACDCEMRWFREWTNKGGRKILKSPEKTQCAEPKDFNGQAIQEVPIEYMTCPMTKGTSTSVAAASSSKTTVAIFSLVITALAASGAHPVALFVLAVAAAAEGVAPITTHG